MISKRQRYFLIGLLFAIVTIISTVWNIKTSAHMKSYTYTLISAFIAILFLKNSIFKQ